MLSQIRKHPKIKIKYIGNGKIIGVFNALILLVREFPITYEGWLTKIHSTAGR